MGFEEDRETETQTPTLPLFSAKPHTSQVSSPLHTLASVPFCWEEEPGKPKHYYTTASTDLVTHKCLELPPRLLITKLPSPSSVLESPYSMGRSRRSDSSSSLKMILMMGGDCYGSFRRDFSPDHGGAEMKQQLGALVLEGGGKRDLGIVGLWRRKRAFRGKREMGRGSYVFPTLVHRDRECSREAEEIGDGNNNTSVNITRTSAAESYNGLSPSKTHFWTTMYKGLKQVAPWSSKKMRRESL